MIRQIKITIELNDNKRISLIVKKQNAIEKILKIKHKDLEEYDKGSRYITDSRRTNHWTQEEDESFNEKIHKADEKTTLAEIIYSIQKRK